MEVDDALRLLGTRNTWQIRTFFVYGIAFGVVFGWMRLSIIFIGKYKVMIHPNPRA